MARLIPLLVILLAVFVMWKFSAITSGRSLRRHSHPLQNDQIERLLNRLAAAAGVDRIHVRVLEQPVINGLATPSGDIYLTRGLIREYQGGRISAEELASVVAHELGHLALGHTRRRMIDVAGAQILHVVLGGLLARLIPFIGWYIARFVSQFFVATLSRKDEFEADAYATALMLRAGIGAEPQARMLEKLVNLAAAAETGPQWLASHPPVAERADAIRANARRWQRDPV